MWFYRFNWRESATTWLKALGEWAELVIPVALPGTSLLGPARYLHRGLHIYPDGEAEEIRPLPDEMNSDECIGAYRVVVFMDCTLEGIAALIRHELEHGRQRDAHGRRLMELYNIAENVISERVRSLPGGGFLYQVIPVEMDANAAVSSFIREHFGQERIDELLHAGDKDGSEFRSLVGPGRSRGYPSE